jgi:RNA polymerase sigma-70 factor, ECF subfamily
LSSEVFIKMLKALPGYENRSKPFQAWLFQIARFLAIDHFRKNHRHQEVALEEYTLTPVEHIDQAVEKSLAAETIYSVIEELPEDQRDVLIMRFILGLAIAEVAETLNKSQDAIKGLQRRGLLSMRNRLAEMELSL